MADPTLIDGRVTGGGPAQPVTVMNQQMPQTQSLASGAATSANQTTELTRLGDVTEAAPANDTASSGLNGRLQRIAQRITSMIALLDGSSITTATFAIANGASLSSPSVDLSGKALLRLLMPATWTTAALTFQTSMDDASYFDTYDSSGNEYTVQAAASRSIIINPADFPGVRYLKIRSGTSGTPVNQGGARTITAVIRAI